MNCTLHHSSIISTLQKYCFLFIYRFFWSCCCLCVKNYDSGFFLLCLRHSRTCPHSICLTDRGLSSPYCCRSQTPPYGEALDFRRRGSVRQAGAGGPWQAAVALAKRLLFSQHLVLIEWIWLISQKINSHHMLTRGSSCLSSASCLKCRCYSFRTSIPQLFSCHLFAKVPIPLTNWGTWFGMVCGIGTRGA